jgi:hypothetical protein
MNKLHNFLAFLKKYHFWIICGMVLVTTLACWWWSTAGLAGQFQARRTKIEGDFSALNIPMNHPNEGVINDVRKKEAELKQRVYDAGEILYREQKKNNPFPAELGEDFKEKFESLQPQRELDREYRDRYQNYIEQHFPTLKETVDVRRPPEEAEETGGGAAGSRGAPRRRGIGGPPMGAARGMYGGEGGGRPMRGDMSGMPGMPGMPGTLGSNELPWIGVVDWNDTDYDKLVQGFKWLETPSTMEVVLAQEDLWVYEALLRVIKSTNEKATNRANAVVSRIETLEIGPAAGNTWSQSEEPVFRAAKTSQQMSAETERRTRTLSRMGDVQEGGLQRLMEGRYLDDKGQPLPYVKDYPYAQHPYRQFKMMPIYMNLMMDQRSLPKLLVECANSNMPIEVRRACIKTTSDEPLDLKVTATEEVGGGPAAMSGEGRLERGNRGSRGARTPGMTRGASRGDPMSGMGGGLQTQDLRPYDVPVQIFGVIYIYNPPAPETLGVAGALAEKTAGAAAPSEAKTPPPPTPPAAIPVKPSQPPATVPAAPVGRPAAPPAAPPSPPPSGR